MKVEPEETHTSGISERVFRKDDKKRKRKKKIVYPFREGRTQEGSRGGRKEGRKGR